MNPLSNVKGTQRINDRELELGLTGTKKSWHNKYKDSAWVFIGGLPYDLTEGDVICIFSQYGEIVNINLVRDQKTGKSKGFAFACFEDQRSTILTVDNLNGAKVLGRTLRVDHVEQYKVPQEKEDRPVDAITLKLRDEGCAPKLQDSEPESEEEDVIIKEEPKEEKSHKKKAKKKKKKKDKYSDSESESDDREHRKKKKKYSKDRDSSESSDTSRDKKRSRNIAPVQVKVKKEKIDPGYDKYATRVLSQDREGSRDRKGRNRNDDQRFKGERYERLEREDRGYGDSDRRRKDRDRYDNVNENGSGRGRDYSRGSPSRSPVRDRFRKSRSRSRDRKRRSRSRDRSKRSRSREQYRRDRSSSSEEQYRSKDRKRNRSRSRDRR